MRHGIQLLVLTCPEMPVWMVTCLVLHQSAPGRGVLRAKQGVPLRAYLCGPRHPMAAATMNMAQCKT